MKPVGVRCDLISIFCNGILHCFSLEQVFVDQKLIIMIFFKSFKSLNKILDGTKELDCFYFGVCVQGSLAQVLRFFLFFLESLFNKLNKN